MIFNSFDLLILKILKNYFNIFLNKKNVFDHTSSNLFMRDFWRSNFYKLKGFRY